MKPVCDYDCFHCPYEDCINDEMRFEDYQEGKELELISGAKEYNTSESRRAAQKKYREENKEKVAAAQWTIVNKKDTIFKYIFWERLDYLPIPECCFHFIWCQIA